ncbi:MAG: rod shape-determining protein MreD [Prevotella sp.]|nr:rod shape-determining protein MreD [Prevotella sp.]
MNVDFLKSLLWFAVLTLAQVFVLNHIHLFAVATPLLYIYFILQFRRNYPQWGILLWGFFMGVIIDTFSNTPGVAAGSLTLTAALQPFILQPFIPRDSSDDFQPGMDTLGVPQYTWYAAILTLIYNVAFFSLEMFSFFNVVEWLECIGGSSLLTLVLILVVENVRRQ